MLSIVSDNSSQPPPPTAPTIAAEQHEEEEEEEEEAEKGGRGTWKHAAFHVATTIATPAAYAPLPFALASLGWPLDLNNYLPELLDSIWDLTDQVGGVDVTSVAKDFGSWCPAGRCGSKKCCFCSDIAPYCITCCAETTTSSQQP